MKTIAPTLLFSVLVVSHPTIIGATVPLRRVRLTSDEEARIKQVSDKAETSGHRLKEALTTHLE